MRFFRKLKQVYTGPQFSHTEPHNLSNHDNITCKYCSSKKMTLAFGFLNNPRMWISYCLECGLTTVLTNNKILNK